MTCTDFQEKIMDVARGVNPSEAALAHAATCPDCARRLAEEHSLTTALSELRLSTQHSDAPLHIEKALVARTPRSAGGPPARLSPKWIIPIAAALLIAAWLRFSNTEPKPQSILRHQVTSSSPRVAPVPSEPPPVRPAARRKHRPAAPRPPQPRPELATDFFRVPFADPLDPTEDAQVVRVNLPRASLVSLGLLIDENRASERIQADVVLGQDGMARAIRFVR